MWVCDYEYHVITIMTVQLECPDIKKSVQRFSIFPLQQTIQLRRTAVKLNAA